MVVVGGVAADVLARFGWWDVGFHDGGGRRMEGGDGRSKWMCLAMGWMVCSDGDGWWMLRRIQQKTSRSSRSRARRTEFERGAMAITIVPLLSPLCADYAREKERRLSTILHRKDAGALWVD